MKIAVIGGGASGLFAAAAAGQEGSHVVVLERGKRVGKKILATGNGRCNMTNIYASTENYHGESPEFTEAAQDIFWTDKAIEFFEHAGVLTKVEEAGKVYPYSDTASSVLDILRRECDKSGAETICGFDVKTVKKTGNVFSVESYDGRKIKADKVIIACGGKAAPDLGSNGSGYDLLKRFGHRITKLSPSLVQIKTETEVVRKLKGIKINARVRINSFESEGELLFTDYGLSGPPVFTLSSRIDGAKNVVIDIMPEYGYSDVLSLLKERRAYLSDVNLEEFFTGMLNKRVGQALLKYINAAPLSRLTSTLSDDELKKIASVIKGWSFGIVGTMSWNNAQVTHGGAATESFDPHTMESRIVKGLYACGEVLDIDGDCGGYNLQWAWSSGYIAGKSAAGAVL